MDITELKRPYDKLDIQGMTATLRGKFKKARKATGLTLTELMYLALEEFAVKYKDSIEEECRLRDGGSHE